MTFSIDWTPSAEQDLARLWVDHPDVRNAVTAAVAAVEADLRRQPLDVGESRAGVTRVTFDGPVGLRFDVFSDRRLVRVTGVWRAR